MNLCVEVTVVIKNKVSKKAIEKITFYCLFYICYTRLGFFSVITYCLFVVSSEPFICSQYSLYSSLYLLSLNFNLLSSLIFISALYFIYESSDSKFFPSILTILLVASSNDGLSFWSTLYIT